ncbi:Probable RND efflux membrane fusion protein [Sporomusa ovata]|uniref:Probable RND efflux membrane fusion protein n=2 Tax=Sporomusa ovata TaxID=2378 RepID=A0A0U1L3Z8_9FIRM|nr:Probable RND efflux membrane fusion protein [Sporomusa ovata]
MFGVVVVAVVFLGAMMFWKTHNTSSVNMAKVSAMKPLVAVETVRRQDMLSRIVLSGQTVAAAQVEIAPKYKGYITQVAVELGQPVTAGQVLVVQDTKDVEFAIAQTMAAIRQARAETIETKASFSADYQKAAADYERNLAYYQRYEALHTSGAVSRETLDTARQQMINAKSALAALQEQAMEGSVPAMVESKQAALAKAEYNLEALKKQREDRILRAPRAGIIGYRQVEEGAFVPAGQKLLTIVDNGSSFIDFQVSEQNAAQIRTGMQVKVTIDSLGQEYPGTIIYVSPANDAKTQAFTVRLVLMPGEPAIRSGMFAHADITGLLRKQTIFVVKTAILEKNGKNYVFVINDNNQAEQRLVATGQRNDDSVEILAGINEGERVAVSNIARLKQDTVVEVEARGTAL